MLEILQPHADAMFQHGAFGFREIGIKYDVPRCSQCGEPQIGPQLSPFGLIAEIPANGRDYMRKKIKIKTFLRGISALR